jgi:uncharacterized membrane protein YcfT
MSNNGTSSTGLSAASERVDWVDYAKGICIVMVVMMHSTLGVELAAGRHGFMHLVVEFARPFRMPDFFLISGLFLSRVIDRDWRTYLDRKVVHFFYFYVLWTAIQFAFKASSFAASDGWANVGYLYLQSFIEPFGTLWFIYMLPIFFVVTKLTRGIYPPVIWGIAAALEILHVSTEWTIIDEFAARFVYFYSGYILASYVFALANHTKEKPGQMILGLAAWSVAHGILVFAGMGDMPVMSLVLGFAGACAVIVTGTLLARMHWFEWLRYLGEHSIVVYLAFFLPMAATRILLLKTGIIQDIGVISIIVTAAGILGSLAIWWWARRTGLNFLFERPQRYWITPPRPRETMQAAE